MTHRDDGDALQRMLRRTRAQSALPLVFGGLVSRGTLQLTAFFGARTDGLRRLAVGAGMGAGGRALASGRIVAVTDYRDAASISHDYDAPVLAEGIRSVLAAPVVVGGSCRMVAYAATREPVTWGDDIRDELVATAAGVAREIEVRDEVDRRLAAVAASADERELRRSRDAREIAAELRELASTTTDAALAERLGAAARRLWTDTAPVASTVLTTRETHVLRLVSAGLTYPDVGRSLSLSPTTVKSYMRSVTSKLGVHGRHQAVVEARRRGLLDGGPAAPM